MVDMKLMINFHWFENKCGTSCINDNMFIVFLDKFIYIK
jgi:hypothetical protein